MSFFGVHLFRQAHDTRQRSACNIRRSWYLGGDLSLVTYRSSPRRRCHAGCGGRRFPGAAGGSDSSRGMISPLPVSNRQVSRHANMPESDLPRKGGEQVKHLPVFEELGRGVPARRTSPRSSQRKGSVVIPVLACDSRECKARLVSLCVYLCETCVILQTERSVEKVHDTARLNQGALAFLVDESLLRVSARSSAFVSRSRPPRRTNPGS